ncbi:hypothetical protein GGI07_001278 [Coemansia sp. Benny D115]|nr:hypothetical protein GGI07_001278 [Coemansia sp. Benny D115]
MDKLAEFISGLQNILDSPNPPREDLVRVIQSTQRDFLSSALAISTINWPTQTHLELVKIIIGLPIQEPPPEVVMADPTTSHEADPFFAAEYFDKLRLQLLSTPVQQLAESDGSWVRNIGFSIEATIMQASRRADALEKLEELTKADPGGGGQDLSRIRIYCSHILGTGILGTHHWVAIARMIYTMFYVLPFSTRSMLGSNSVGGDSDEEPLHAHTTRLVSHYGSWLQIVNQMIEHHGPTLCRRMPAVVEDPATKQFKWGIPSLHMVATTELLRNFLARRVLLPNEKIMQQSSTEPWAASAAAISAEEKRLEQFEQAILSRIIGMDASAVYGMMCEHHHLLQILEAHSKNTPLIDIDAGAPECLAMSLTRTCYGLAPILGFEEQALTQAMDMEKLRQCLGHMKAAALQTCYAPLCGVYPQGTAALSGYAEPLLLRTTTVMLNIDQPWGDAANTLSPEKISGISQSLLRHLSKVLRVAAIYFETFSLDTTIVQQISPTDQPSPGSIVGRLLQYPFMLQSNADDLSHIFMSDVPQSSTPDQRESLFALLEWVVEFVQFSKTFSAPWIFSTQLAAALQRLIAYYAIQSQLPDIVDCVKGFSFEQWKAMADTRFAAVPASENNSAAGSAAYDSVLSIVWGCVQRFSKVDTPKWTLPDSISADSWQATASLSYPAGAFLAYLVVRLCADTARQLVHLKEDSRLTVVLNNQGIEAIQRLKCLIAPDGLKALPANMQPLFVPPIYSSSTGRSKDTQIVSFACSQLPVAMSVLSNTSITTWATQLGVAPQELLVSEQDMRAVAHFVSYYAENASDFFPQLAKTLLSPQSVVNGRLKPTENPFKTPNILSKLPPIESQHNANACDVAATVRLWMRNISQLSYSESRAHIQQLISECYPSNFKHYLDQVVIRFMEEEPQAGVDLVIGSIAEHLWKKKVVYSRQLSPLYAIREMFLPYNPPKPPNPGASAERIDIPATTPSKPVFNAVVGGKVRQNASGVASVPSTPTSRNARAGGPMNVRNPEACLRIALLLTTLRYGNSMSDTPIHIWLTDCLDHAPALLLRSYFGSLFKDKQPSFAPDLPVETEWAKKVRAFISLWVGDVCLHGRSMMMNAGTAVLEYALEESGIHWDKRWSEWAPIVSPLIVEIFSKHRTKPLQADIVHRMLHVPLSSDSTNLEENFQGHPMDVLFKLLSPTGEERERLTFASKRDWFLTHILPCMLDTVVENQATRAILGHVISSVDFMYATVPWFDIATSLVQNVPLRRGCPVAMNAELAKKHFVAYVSPLARILFAVSDYVEGKEGDAVAEEEPVQDTDLLESENEGGLKSANPNSVPLSAASVPDTDDPVEDSRDISERDFSWPWLEECLAICLHNAALGDSFDDIVDALLDVYTHSSVQILRNSIESVVVASCLHDSQAALKMVRRAFAKRPLDISTLHLLRPRTLSDMAPLAQSTTDSDSSFRPGAEIYPLVRRILQLAIGEDSQTVDATSKAIESCMWDICEEPDIRRSLIALKPRLIPKEQRPAAQDMNDSHEAVLHLTSGSLHIPAEAIASAGAYALDRTVYFLGLLSNAYDRDEKIDSLLVKLAYSRVFMATLMTAVGETMRQFPSFPTVRELLNALWALVVSREGDAAENVWIGTNFYALAQRLNTHAPEEFISWETVQPLLNKQQ